MNHQDNMAARATGEWQKHLYSDDLNNRSYAANVKTLMLGVRVRDDSARTLLGELRGESVSATISRDQKESELAMMKMAASFQKLNENRGTSP
jgi:hypothetical protein